LPAATFSATSCRLTSGSRQDVALVVYPGGDVRGIGANEAADPLVGRLALGDATGDVTGAAAEVLGELVDGDQLGEVVGVGGHAGLS